MYIIILTGVCGVLLAGVSEVLKPKQQAAVELERQTFILTAALGEEEVAKYKPDEVVLMYETMVVGEVYNNKGEKQEGDPKDVNLKKEYKKAADVRELPVYKINKDGKTIAVVFPVYGYGLWDNIWGYVALEPDMKTVKGVVFDHKGETPGLGARITETKIESRYVGKEVRDDQTITGIEMQKGEGNSYDGEPHKVDGMSGATKTAEGLNAMFTNYFELYKPFMDDFLNSNNS